MVLTDGVAYDVFLRPEKSRRFLLALLAAAILEISMVWAAAYYAQHAQPKYKQPQTVKIQVISPPKPKPVPPKPIPPKPIPPKPMPPKPKPIVPPKPIPKPVVRHTVTPKPRPVEHQVHTPPPPPPQPAPIPEAVQANALELYAGAVHETVQAGLQVPETVKMMGLSGATEVALQIAPDGMLLNASVVKSSGISLIDRAALSAVRMAKYPAFTADMPNHEITVDITVKLKSGSE